MVYIYIACSDAGKSQTGVWWSLRPQKYVYIEHIHIHHIAHIHPVSKHQKDFLRVPVKHHFFVPFFKLEKKDKEW